MFDLALENLTLDLQIGRSQVQQALHLPRWSLGRSVGRSHTCCVSGRVAAISSLVATAAELNYTLIVSLESNTHSYLSLDLYDLTGIVKPKRNSEHSH